MAEDDRRMGEVLAQEVLLDGSGFPRRIAEKRVVQELLEAEVTNM